MGPKGKANLIILVALAMTLGCGKDYETANNTPPEAGPAPAADTGEGAPPAPQAALNTPAPSPLPKKFSDIQARGRISDLTASPGDQVTVPIQISGASGGVIAGLDVRITYPANLLEPKGVVGSPLLADFQMASNLSSPGKVNFVATKVKGGGQLSDDAHLADVVFQVKQDAPVGAKGEFRFVRFDIAQPDLAMFHIDIEDAGSVTIVGK